MGRGGGGKERGMGGGSVLFLNKTNGNVSFFSFSPQVRKLLSRVPLSLVYLFTHKHDIIYLLYLERFVNF